jgi:hypothetical protein
MSGVSGADWRIRIRTSLEQQFDERRAAVGARARQRRHPEIVRRVRIGAGTDQQVGGRHIVPVRRPEQRRRSVRRAQVDISLATEQRTDLRLILGSGCINQPRIVGSGSEPRDDNE